MCARCDAFAAATTPSQRAAWGGACTLECHCEVWLHSSKPFSRKATHKKVRGRAASEHVLLPGAVRTARATCRPPYRMRYKLLVFGTVN